MNLNKILGLKRGDKASSIGLTLSGMPYLQQAQTGIDETFSCVVKTQERKSKKIYKNKLTKIRYKIK